MHGANIFKYFALIPFQPGSFKRFKKLSGEKKLSTQYIELWTQYIEFWILSSELNILS